MESWQRLSVTSRTDWAEGLMTIALGGVPAPFLPGQFVNLAADRGEKRVKRAYSLASAPGQPYEFLISRVGTGVFTPFLFGLKVGNALEVEARPSGLFTLDWLPEFATELWLLATGTGLGPFMSMLRAPGLLFPRFRRVTLGHCVRTFEQLAYSKELRRLALEESRFRYIPVLTRESQEGALSGRLPAHIESGALERSAELDFSAARSHFMLCGNPAMIRDAGAALQARGLHKHRQRNPGHVSTEKYWT